MPQPKLISVKQGTQIVDLLCDSYVSCDVYGVCICMTVCRYIKSVTRSRLRDVLASADGYGESIGIMVKLMECAHVCVRQPCVPVSEYQTVKQIITVCIQKGSDYDVGE